MIEIVFIVYKIISFRIKLYVKFISISFLLLKIIYIYFLIKNHLNHYHQSLYYPYQNHYFNFLIKKDLHF